MIRQSILIGLIGLICATAQGDEPQQKFPFAGRVTVDNANIRSGADQNFEILAKLNSGDTISVLEQTRGWYKVKLPGFAYCYVAKDLIEANGTTGISKASRLNLRARPNRESAIIGQIQKNDAITIINGDAEGWYQIMPPETSSGWIRADLVEYYVVPPVKAEEPKKQKKGFLWL
jgi:uncharacterized protein YgiM (DUF1202 family)